MTISDVWNALSVNDFEVDEDDVFAIMEEKKCAVPFPNFDDDTIDTVIESDLDVTTQWMLESSNASESELSPWSIAQRSSHIRSSRIPISLYDNYGAKKPSTGGTNANLAFFLPNQSERPTIGDL